MEHFTDLSVKRKEEWVTCSSVCDDRLIEENGGEQKNCPTLLYKTQQDEEESDKRSETTNTKRTNR